jgi:hypothetical protein
MKTKSLEKLIWVLIYVGLLTVCLAVFIARADETTGWWVGSIGGASALLGAVLIVVRSRMSDPPKAMNVNGR